MTHKQNGEPAFPRPLSISTGAVGDQQILANEQDGMSLRDYFAAKAIQGICASGPGSQWSNDMLACEAYSLADAMIKAREKKECTG